MPFDGTWLHVPSFTLGCVLGLIPFGIIVYFAARFWDYLWNLDDRSKMPWGDETPFRCPVCKSWKNLGHRPTCKLGRDLARYDKENARG
jgi:hypothetical protein